MEDSGLITIKANLNSSDREVRLRACWKLADIEDPDKVPTLISCFTDSYWPVRNKACDILTLIPADAVVPPLILGLKSDNENIAYWSSMALSKFMSADTINILVREITSGNEQLSRWIMNTLTLMGREIIDLLLPYLNSESFDVRFWILKVLAKYGEKSVVDKVIPLLDDSRWPVRKNAVFLIGEIGDTGNYNRLVDCFSDSSWSVRKEAGEALSKIAARNSLLKGSSEFQSYQNTFLKIDAIKPDLVENIYINLENENIDILSSTIKLIGKFKLDDAVPYLLKFLREQQDPLVKIAAVKASAAFDEPEIILQLKTLFLEPATSDSIRFEIIKSLFEISTPDTQELITQLFNESSQDMKISILHLLADSPPENLKDFFISILFNFDEYISQLALKSLSHFDDERLINVYLECLNKDSPLIIKESIICIGKTMKKDLKMFVIPFIDHTNIDIRRAALIATGMMKISDVEDKLLAILDHDPENNRDCFFLVDTLSKIGGEKTLASFIRLFEMTNNANIKHWLICGFQNFDTDKVRLLLKESLFKYSHKMTLAALSSLLNFSTFPDIDLNELLHDNSFEIRNIAVDLIRKFSLKKYADSMMELYRNEFSMYIRKNLIKTIGSFKITASIPLFMEAFNDTNWPIRKIAMSSICSIVRSEKLEFREFVTGKSFSDDQLFWIIKIFGELGTNLDYLFNMMETRSDNTDILIACIESISKFDSSPEADAVFLNYLDSSDPKIVKATVKALKNTNNLIFLDKIEKIFDNYNGEIKLWAAIALKGIGNTGTIELLQSALKKKEVFLSRYIEQSIESISEKMLTQGDSSDG